MFKPNKPINNVEDIIQELEDLESLVSSLTPIQPLEMAKSVLTHEELLNSLFLSRLLRNQAKILRLQLIQTELWKETEFLKRIASVIEQLDKKINYLS